MIISASRRTDIPAFFSDWLLNRLNEGYVLVRNPINHTHVSRVDLEPGKIDCFVFWTKNPEPLIGKLGQLKNYQYYFLFTISAYGNDLEQNLPAKDRIIETFIKLSKNIGREKVIWRYDPILLSSRIDCSYHVNYFTYLAGKLASYTERCIISFLDMYNKCKRNLAGFNIKLPNHEEMTNIAGKLQIIAQKHHIVIETCAETVDFSAAGLRPGKCIDDGLIKRITGRNSALRKDKYQRKTCRCVESVDIGAYNTCSHHCMYCYANSNLQAVQKNTARHDPQSPLLSGSLTPNDKILERGVKPLSTIQRTLF